MHAYTHVYADLYKHVYAHVSIVAYAHARVYPHVYTHLHTCPFAFPYTFPCRSLCKRSSLPECQRPSWSAVRRNMRYAYEPTDVTRLAVLPCAGRWLLQRSSLEGFRALLAGHNYNRPQVYSLEGFRALLAGHNYNRP